MSRDPLFDLPGWGRVEPERDFAWAVRRLLPRAPICSCATTRTWRRCTCVGSAESLVRLARLLEDGLLRFGDHPAVKRGLGVQP